MSGIQRYKQPRRGILDKLAQNGAPPPYSEDVNKLFVYGQGTLMQDRLIMLNRHKKKNITVRLILGLIKIAEEKKAIERAQQYRNTYYCLHTVITASGRLHGKYCKNRVCLVCSSIRRADLINQYLPILQLWEDPYFLTLTIQSTPANGLAKQINRIEEVIKKIVKRFRRRKSRGHGIKLEGIRSLECNFNPVEYTYNPHFHIILRNKRMAVALRREWIEYWPEDMVNPGAQFLFKVTDVQHQLIEVIKYAGKIFTEPGRKGKRRKWGKRPDPKTSQYIYLSALDNIIAAMHGRRIFDRFGFNGNFPKKPGKTSVLGVSRSWTFDLSKNNWISDENGLDRLLASQLSDELLHILENNLDFENQ